MDGVVCIKFADEEVKRILVENYDDNKDGDISYEEAKAEHTLFKFFAENTKIETFDEFKYFNMKILYDYNFTNCASLRSIALPSTYTAIRYQDFKGTALEHIELPDTLTTISSQAFFEVSTLKEISLPESVTSIGGNAFTGTGISRFLYPPKVTEIDGLGSNPNLTYVEIKGENVTSVTGMGNCPLLQTLVIRTTTPPSTNYWTLLNAPKIPNIYVPDASVDSYKTSNNWSKWAAYIKPISEMPTES